MNFNTKKAGAKGFCAKYIVYFNFETPADGMFRMVKQQEGCTCP